MLGIRCDAPPGRVMVQTLSGPLRRPAMMSKFLASVAPSQVTSNKRSPDCLKICFGFADDDRKFSSGQTRNGNGEMIPVYLFMKGRRVVRRDALNLQSSGLL